MTRLVLLPGWGMRPAVFEPLFDALGSGFEIVAREMPGGPWEDWAAGLARDASPAIWCGWSLGAMVALEVARRFPEKVEGLVLIAGTPRFSQAADWACAVRGDALADFRDGLATDARATLRQFVALQSLGDAMGRALGQQLARVCETTYSDSLAEGLAMLSGCDLREAVSSIAAPSLLIHGAADRLVPLAAGQFLRDQLPRARLHAFEDCAHAPHVSQPRAVAAVMRGFIESVAR